MSYKIAGIDVHKKVLMVVVIDASMPESKPERRRFATMPSDLRRLLSWLREQGVEEAVMESTAQYWRSVWLELEPYMRLQLAQAFSNRAPRGRKHDFKDAYQSAIWAIAHRLCRLVWKILHEGVRFIEQSSQSDPKVRKQRARILARALRKLGYDVAITPINPATTEMGMQM